MATASAFHVTRDQSHLAWDPKSGTAEFKATAIRIEKLPAAEPVA